MKWVCNKKDAVILENSPKGLWVLLVLENEGGYGFPTVC